MISELVHIEIFKSYASSRMQGIVVKKCWGQALRTGDGIKGLDLKKIAKLVAVV